MAGFVSKQPNGLYCRFSSVTDCPTAWNMTREDYINMKMQEAKEDAEDVFLETVFIIVDVAVLIYGTLERSNREYNNVSTIKERINVHM